MSFPMYSAGTPVSPLPIVGRRAHLPSNTLTAHLADAADPHGVRALVPALRAGSGAPSVEPADKATDFYFDTAGSLLYVMEEVSGTRSWAAVATQALQGEDMEANPTQRQLSEAVKKIWKALGGTVICLMMCLTLFAEVTGETEWQDVPPGTPMGTVVSDLSLCTVAAARAMTNAIVHPVTSVNSKTGDVNLAAADVGARPNSWTPTAADVGARPSDWMPTAVDVGAVAVLPDGGVAIGKGTSASGYASHAEGYNTTASGYYSHAEGHYTTADGDYSHAEGSGTTAYDGDYSHAEGSGTTASGNASHAEGYATTADGDYSHAEGVFAKANEIYSFAWNGDEYITYNSHGIGTFNLNPLGGLSGLWIGESTLETILGGYAKQSDVGSRGATNITDGVTSGTYDEETRTANIRPLLGYTNYALSGTNQTLALDRSVQYVSISGTDALKVLAPTRVYDKARDFIVYVNTAGTNALDLTELTGIYATDASATNAVTKGMTMLMFTELTTNTWVIGRQTLKALK